MPRRFRLLTTGLFSMRNFFKYQLLFPALWGISITSAHAQLLVNDSSPALPLAIAAVDSLSRTGAVITSFRISNIIIVGNNKTKSYIIERELPFKKGDSINLSQLVEGFEVARQQLMNTRLFNEAVVSLKAFRGYSVDILIEVRERWYIFPLPYLKPVDRNFSEWLKQDLTFDRVNYGFKFNHNNFSGRNDKLRIWLINGYSQQVQFQYEQPYADPRLRHGFKVGFLYAMTRDLNYATVNNEQRFTDTLGGLKRWNVFAEYLYRPGLRTFNTFRLAWSQEEVDNRVFKVNPNYFNHGNNRLTYLELSYRLNFVKVDYIPYPLTGWMGEMSFSKKGFNREMNLWQLSGKYTQSWKILPKTWLGVQTMGLIRFPYSQPFINQRLFGYGDFYLRGLENYVVDGVGGMLLRNTVRRSIYKTQVSTGFRSRAHAVIPFRFYAKAFADFGYAHHPLAIDTRLTNRMMYTAGLGIDMVTIYDFVLRMDYSFNQLGENGLFLHIKTEF